VLGRQFDQLDSWRAAEFGGAVPNAIDAANGEGQASGAVVKRIVNFHERRFFPYGSVPVVVVTLDCIDIRYTWLDQFQ
jgi:hypothetical protein